MVFLLKLSDLVVAFAYFSFVGESNMASKNGRSEEKTDLFGNRYVQHYNEKGEKIGTSEEKKTLLFGDSYTQHYDQKDKKSGTSEEKETLVFGDRYTQHYDQRDKKSGTSEEKETLVFGDRYTQHYDQRDKKSGTSEEKETLIFGDRYTQHYKEDVAHNISGELDGTASSKYRARSVGVGEGQSSVNQSKGYLDGGSFFGDFRLFLWSPLLVLVGLYFGQFYKSSATENILMLFLMLPVGLFGLVLWVIGYLISIPLFAIEYFAGICLTLSSVSFCH
jgi:hypothetical protein